MRISNNYSPAFGLKFVNNKAFKEVKEFVKKDSMMQYDFNAAIEKLKTAKEGNVTIKHGIKDNKNFSMFILNDVCLFNTPYYDESYVEATYRCIIDLATFASRYRILTKEELNHRRM